MLETDQIKEEFVLYVKELFSTGNTNNILDKLILKFNLAGRHTASRRIERYFGKKYFDLLKEYKTLGFIFEESEESFRGFLNKELSNLCSSNYGPMVGKGCSKYHISKREFHRRCKSILGETLKDYVIRVSEPTREEIDKSFILSNSSDEFFESLGILPKSDIRRGFYQRHFGCSTFSSAKAKVVFRREFPKYTPTIDDNLSLIYSQYLGDGGYDSIRNSFRIDHGRLQYEYLKFKVQLFNKAFPETNGLETVKRVVHKTQGFEFCTWYSKKLPSFNICTKEEMVDKLTPLGVLLYYLDDGCLHKHYLSIASSDESVKVAIHKKMLSYGIRGSVTTSGWAATKLSEIIKFLHTFVLPYEDIIPVCMAYKYDLKI